MTHLSRSPAQVKVSTETLLKEFLRIVLEKLHQVIWNLPIFEKGIDQETRLEKKIQFSFKAEAGKRNGTMGHFLKTS